MPLQILSSSLNLWELNLLDFLLALAAERTNHFFLKNIYYDCLMIKILATVASVKIQDKDFILFYFIFLKHPTPFFGKAT